MATENIADQELVASGLAVRRQRTISNHIVDFTRRKPLGAAGGLILILFVFMAIFAPVIDRYDPLETAPFNSLQSPTWDHWFGTDNFGRDMYSRIVNGAILSMYVGVISTALGAMVGSVLGLASAYFRGWVDLLLQRWLDVMFIFPGLILALAIVTVFQGSDLLRTLGFGSLYWGNLNVIVIAIAIPRVPGTARVIRSVALAVMSTQYMDASEAVGARPMRRIFRHLMPNCMAPFIVYSTAQIGGAILTESSLTFLGIGVAPEIASWGRMLSVEGMRYFEAHPYLAVFPGIAISAAVFGINLFGDALRDVLDPRLRGAERR
jgi:peptide/nickel transport system permease protein